MLHFSDLDFGNRVRMGNHMTLKSPSGNEILDLRKREDRSQHIALPLGLVRIPRITKADSPHPTKVSYPILFIPATATERT